MLKHLGTFAILAVCLFTMAMGDCNRDDTEGGGVELIDNFPPPEPTPMEKLAGLYTLVELRDLKEGGVVVSPPNIGGVLSLFPYFGPSSDSNNKASIWFRFSDGDISELEGTWSADEATITLFRIMSTGYTWDGTYLTLFRLDYGGGLEIRTKWRQKDKW